MCISIALLQLCYIGVREDGDGDGDGNDYGYYVAYNGNVSILWPTALFLEEEMAGSCIVPMMLLVIISF